MNINDITIEELRKMAALADRLCEEGSGQKAGKHVIVRGDRSGVFYGRLVSQEGQRVVMSECRHIWYWDGAANTAEIAAKGVSRPKNCKIVGPVSNIEILDGIEVIDCTPEAVASLDAVPEWSAA